MATPLVTIQYLEDSPGLPGLDQLVKRLRSAAEYLPISHLLIGWHLPQPVLEACRLEAEKLGLRFLRWQPLLTTDKYFQTDPDWYVEGLSGKKLQGYQGRPEFTFFCPNHPAVREAVSNNLASQLRQGIYQGFFLDRARFPSPSSEPFQGLACFCQHCYHKAARQGIDLAYIRRVILQQSSSEAGSIALVSAMLSRQVSSPQSTLDQAVCQLLSFRQASIRDFLALVYQPLREAHMEIGLDCFSPCLTTMVGQDLPAMSNFADWIKLMTYAHTIAPAGLPFELSGLIHFLVEHTALEETRAVSIVSELCGLPLPDNPRILEAEGLSSLAIEKELKRGLEGVSIPILAGIELVDLPGVTHLTPAQIRSDLAAVKRSAADGLSISWDLLHITHERLELLAQAYFHDGASPT